MAGLALPRTDLGSPQGITDPSSGSTRAHAARNSDAVSESVLFHHASAAVRRFCAAVVISWNVSRTPGAYSSRGAGMVCAGIVVVVSVVVMATP